MKCPIHKDVELIQEFYASVTQYHCYKCLREGKRLGTWRVAELVEYLAKHEKK